MDWMLDALGELVSCESPSSDADATRRCGELATELVATHLDGEPERIVLGGRTHLRWTWGTPKVLVLGHIDTVWPTGTLARWPFSVDGDVVTGPGVFDMKAGVVQSVAALSTLPSLDGLSLLLTVDEELGSPTSADLVVESARGCAAAFVTEAAAGEAVKVARKGISLYELAVTGRAAHAGLEPEKGVNAGVALAHAILGIASLGDASLGTTVTPTLASIGTTSNTVPAQARVAIDARAAVPEELPRVDAALRALTEEVRLAVPGSAVDLTGGVNRLPLDAASSAELFLLAQKVAARLGMPELQGVSVGGGSDGNFTAGAGVATLDGLGAVGGGAHAEGEHVLLSHMEPRALLLAGLIEEVL
jgi:glutamate carboxypeptidase